MGKRRPSSPYYLTEAEIPPSADPFWSRLVEMVLPFMEGRRTSVAQLMEHRPDFSYSTASNLLYWLENNSFTRTERENDVVYWRLVPPPKVTVPPTICPVCGGPWKVMYAGIVCTMCGRLRDYLCFSD
jgi:hypothetical protein